MNDWSLTIKEINKQTDVFTPLDIKKKVNNSTTINNYINHLKKMGYIERVGNGKYIKIEVIPVGITNKSIQRIIYDPNFKRMLKLRKLINKIK